MSLSTPSTPFNGSSADNQLVTYTLQKAGATAAGTYVVGTPTFPFDIVSIVVRNETAGSTGTLIFKVAASGTATGSGTNVTGANGTGDTLSGFTAATAKEVSFAVDGSAVRTYAEKNLAAYTTIAAVVAGTVGSLADVTVDVVVRKKVGSRVTDTGAIFPTSP